MNIYFDSIAFIKKLSYFGYLKFIRLFRHREENYLNVQDDIFKGMSIKEISENAMTHWNDIKGGK